MTALSYTVTEADGLRTYRCGRCGKKLTYLVEKVAPELVRRIDHVARELQERHCRKECRGRADTATSA